MNTRDDFARPRSASDGDRLARRESARRQRRRRRAALLALIGTVAIAALVIDGVGGGARGARLSPAGHAPRSVNASNSALRGARPRPRVVIHARAPARSPGALAQTHAYPSGKSAQFKSMMASLWSGIVHDSLSQALAAFFPKDAYIQLKAIVSAGSDWTDRLVNDYGLDVAAAHALLGRGGASARLIRVAVRSGYGHWIEPGVCYNSIGYYEMPNARIVYRDSGEVRSFGIASMISWRGVWYVVHLGAILRPTVSGVVDEPASGAGNSAYSGTC